MENYEVCKHVASIGQTAVYVTPGCKRANMIRGTLVSSKKGAKSADTLRQRLKAEFERLTADAGRLLTIRVPGYKFVKEE